MGTVTQYNLANVRDALGGGNPVHMINYYRGGPYVPANRTVATTVYEPAGGGWIYSNFYRWQAYPAGTSKGGAPYPGEISVMWAGTFVYRVFSDTGQTSVTVDGITYYKGPSASGGFMSTSEFNVRRQYSSSSQVSINTGVPSGGSISISQLYGATNP
jgi:hypothetical protein